MRIYPIKKSFKKSVNEATALLFLLLAAPAQAGVLDDINTKLRTTGQSARLNANLDPTEVFGRIVNGLFGFLGTIFIVLIIYAGFTWMTAGGNEQKVEQAKKILTNATIGLLVVILAYAITKMIVVILRQAGI